MRLLLRKRMLTRPLTYLLRQEQRVAKRSRKHL